MGTRYVAEYLGAGVERDFAASLTATADLTSHASVERPVAAACSMSGDLACAGSMDRNCAAGLAPSADFSIALSLEARARRRRRGVLVFGCG